MTEINPLNSSESSHPSNPSNDSSSPYYLHPRDNPDSLLVSEIFVGDNYIAWSRSITMALTVKNKDQSAKKMIGIAFEKYGLYHLSQITSKEATCNQPQFNSSSFASAITQTQLDIWHYRLGHVSNSRLPSLRQIEPSISLDSTN
ncbi:hypothetical protein F2P56_011534, partial [Juglans regia]